ncbi:MAG: hypothetical protein EOP52_09435 [Sphingobacteriales bacterium]|nr:MAG: hypothetical protein EOP52_09435 [Sphingobacteriales bacterium]
MTTQQKADFEKAILEHKLKIDKQIQTLVEQGLADGTISDKKFEAAPNGDLHFRLNDQQGTEIIYNVTQKKVYSYGGKINQ